MTRDGDLSKHKRISCPMCGAGEVRPTPPEFGTRLYCLYCEGLRVKEPPTGKTDVDPLKRRVS